jgi:hypothetical protein
MSARMRIRSFVIALAAVACLVAAEAGAREEASWVRYQLPGTRSELTMRWQLLGSDGEKLVIKVETFLDGNLRATREIKRARLQVPEQHRRETIVAGGKKYDCKVFELRGTTYWYSEDVPLLGMVRSQRGDRDIMELLDSSTRRQE